jgi:hypothetical protein
MTKPYVNKTTQNPSHPQQDKDIFRCAYIDGNGSEITITEEMIQQSCEAITGESSPPQRTKNKNPRLPDH